MAYWDKLTSRGNIEDRRGQAAVIGGGLGVVGIVASLIYSFLSGTPIDVGQILTQLQGSTSSQQTLTTEDFAGADNYEVFASTVLGSTTDLWRTIFQQSGRTYPEPRLVLFRTATASGCGVATSDVGPHYCPADQTIYIDETFFIELQQRFNAKGGDVAEAYVIAHEVGHHVQHTLGIMDQIQQRGNSNEASIKLELQADCFAGLWAHSIRESGVFQPGEINEAIDAASAVGDDRIQRSVQGQVTPETWTHGSSEQRVEWFTKGYESGSPSACDTFAS
jgi:predicted metalloprotease